jgi:succinate dehydrogenase/fumarate reductase flavoprotein subunit
VHGANRLGGNGVAESTVYGARVGDCVAQWIRSARHSEPRRDQIADGQSNAGRFLERAGNENPFGLREELGRLMWEKVGIIREGENLGKAIAGIADLRKRAEQVSAPGGRRFNLGWQQALDLRNLLTASDLIARSALIREDSRGAHYRSDFDQTDNARWLRNIYLSRDGAEMKSWTVPVKTERLRP